MRGRIIPVMLTLACFSPPVVLAGSPGSTVRAHHRADLTGRLDEHITKQLPDLLAYYKDLHAHPELSLQEKETAGKIARRFEDLGYAVTSNVGGYGVVGVMSNGEGPTVLIRGDMDALPVEEETGLPYRSTVKVTGTDGRPVGVMHACGHDVHQTCLAGTAAALANLRDHWKGTAVLIAQPAEEIGAGARMMIEDGLFERFPRPDYCIALHVSSELPSGTIGYTAGWALANVDSVDITIFGRGGHGSQPHTTIDPVLAAAQVVVSLQTIVSRRINPIEPGVITVGSIHGGSKHNIIPNEAKMQLTVRSYTKETRRILLDGIREVTVNTCRAMGCERDPEVIIREEEFTPATYNDPALVEASAAVLEKVIGAKNVRVMKPRMGGEDFGRYSKYLDVPGFMFFLGSIKPSLVEAAERDASISLPSLHSSKYAPEPEPTIKTGVRCMTSLALSLFDKR